MVVFPAESQGSGLGLGLGVRRCLLCLRLGFGCLSLGFGCLGDPLCCQPRALALLHLLSLAALPVCKRLLRHLSSLVRQVLSRLGRLSTRIGCFRPLLREVSRACGARASLDSGVALAFCRLAPAFCRLALLRFSVSLPLPSPARGLALGLGLGLELGLGLAPPDLVSTRLAPHALTKIRKRGIPSVSGC